MDDRQRIEEYMLTYHCGFRNSAPRETIAKALGIEDRRFRKLCSEMPQIISSSMNKEIPIDFFNKVKVRAGYYILPLVIIDADKVEAKIARILQNELYSRATELRRRADKTALLIAEKVSKQKAFV